MGTHDELAVPIVRYQQQMISKSAVKKAWRVLFGFVGMIVVGLPLVHGLSRPSVSPTTDHAAKAVPPAINRS